jgi:hypothetical protein
MLRVCVAFYRGPANLIGAGDQSRDRDPACHTIAVAVLANSCVLEEVS